MDIWIKTEIDEGKKIIDNFKNTINAVPILLITKNFYIKNKLKEYANNELGNDNFNLEDLMKGRSKNKKVYLIFDIKEFYKNKNSNRYYKIVYPNTIHFKTNLYAKNRLRLLTGLSTGLLR